MQLSGDFNRQFGIVRIGQELAFSLKQVLLSPTTEKALVLILSSPVVLKMPDNMDDLRLTFTGRIVFGGQSSIDLKATSITDWVPFSKLSSLLFRKLELDLTLSPSQSVALSDLKIKARFCRRASLMGGYGVDEVLSAEITFTDKESFNFKLNRDPSLGDKPISISDMIALSGSNYTYYWDLLKPFFGLRRASFAPYVICQQSDIVVVTEALLLGSVDIEKTSFQVCDVYLFNYSLPLPLPNYPTEHQSRCN